MINSKRGFTLIELILSIVIIAIAFIPVSVIYQQVLSKVYVTRIISSANALAEGKMDEVLAQGFSGITNENETNFSSPFDSYSYEVEWHYVQPGSLNTSVDPTVTGYKNVEVRVNHDEIGTLTTHSLLTNY